MDPSLVVVLPIPHCENAEEICEFLKSYGNCVSLEDGALSREKSILVGKIVKEWKIYKDPKGYDKKAYHLESAVPGDASSFRFVASGKRLVSLIDDVFSPGAGDYLALYEPLVMGNAADLPTVYFHHKKATVWVCKTKRKPAILRTNRLFDKV